MLLLLSGSVSVSNVSVMLPFLLSKISVLSSSSMIMAGFAILCEAIKVVAELGVEVDQPADVDSSAFPSLDAGISM